MIDNKKYIVKLKQVPYHKMGIKILDDTQLKNLFPDYEVIQNKIKVHREHIKTIKKYQKEDGLALDNQGNLMYDNVFSIMGQRGAGKTSVVLTLKNILPLSEEGDIALPMIMPEIIPQECSMIGWILSLLEEHVKRLDEIVKKKSIAGNKFNGCMYDSGNLLVKIYNRVKELCYSQFYQPDRAETVLAAALNTQIQTQNSFEFAQELVRFWDTLVENIKQTTEGEQEPLIFIIFDDVDLMPDRAISLLSTIIKYLSHPNIIVLLTADEALLYDVIENDMSKKLGIYDVFKSYSFATSMDSWLEDNTAKVICKLINQKLKVISEIPKLYGDKILPPACRYYLSNYDTTAKKAVFIDRIEFKEEGSRNILLIENVTRQIDDYIKCVGGQPEENFVRDGTNYVRAYLQFFGNTSRQIANEVLILEDFIDELCNLYINYRNLLLQNNNIAYEYYGKLYSTISKFAYSTINASGKHSLIPEDKKYEILNQLIVYKKDIYINYEYVKEMMKSAIVKRFEIATEDILKQAVELIMLLIFIENILSIDSSHNYLTGAKRKNTHGISVLVDIVDEVTTDQYSLICKGQATNPKKFMILYQDLFDSIQEVEKFNPLYEGTVKKYFQLLSYESKEKNVSSETLKRYLLRNPKWLKTMTQILFFSYERIYDVSKDMCIVRKLRELEFKIFDPFFDNSIKNYKETIINTLCEDILSDTEENNIGLNCEMCNDWRDITNCEPFDLSDLAPKIKTITDMNNSWKVIVQEDKLNNIAHSINGVDKLFNWLEELYELLTAQYKQFDRLKMSDETTTIDRIRRIFPRESYELINVISQKVIVRNALNVVIDGIMNKIIKYEKEPQNSFYYGEPNKADSYKEVMDLCAQKLYIPLNRIGDYKMAKNIILYSTAIDYVQKYYIIACLYVQKKISRQNSMEKLPYKKMYDAIISEIKNKANDYLGSTLKGYIREGCRHYVDDLWER